MQQVREVGDIGLTKERQAVGVVQIRVAADLNDFFKDGPDPPQGQSTLRHLGVDGLRRGHEGTSRVACERGAGSVLVHRTEDW